MAALAIAVAVLAAEAPEPETEVGPAEAVEAPAEKPPTPSAPVPPEAEPVETEPVPSPPEPAPAPRVYFCSTSCGVSFPFAGGWTTHPTELRFDWPAFEWGVQLGVDMPHAEARVSYDYRRYNIDQVGGKWSCGRLIICGGWRVQVWEVCELIVGGGAGLVWNSADRAYAEYIIQDSRDFAWRLYSRLRYKPDLPVEFELYGRLTFAKADYRTFGYSSTQDLSAGEFGLAVLGRF